MKIWLRQYKDLMRKTRGISIAGAALVVFGACLDIYNTLHALSLVEISVFSDSEFGWMVGKILLLSLVVVFTFVLRIVVLSWAANRPYNMLAGSWYLAFVIAIGYVWLNSPGSGAPLPDCIPAEGKICFAIYDMRQSMDWITRLTLLYIPCSAIRSFITGAIAACKYSYK